MISYRYLVVFLIALLSLLTGCMEIKEKITISRNGSGSIDTTIVVDKQFASLVVPELRKRLAEEFPGTQVKSERDPQSGNDILSYSQQFLDISEIKGGTRNYTLNRKPDGLFQTRYEFEGRERKPSGFDLDAPIPFEVTLNLPGSILESNGEKLDGDTIRWQWVGERKGGTLSAASSGFSGIDLGGVFKSSPATIGGTSTARTTANDGGIIDRLLYDDFYVSMDKQGLWIEGPEVQGRRLIHKATAGRFISEISKADGGDLYFTERDQQTLQNHAYHYRMGTQDAQEISFGQQFSVDIVPNSTRVLSSTTKPGGTFTRYEVDPKTGQWKNPKTGRHVAMEFFGGESFIADVVTGERKPLPKMDVPEFVPTIDGTKLECADSGPVWAADGGSFAFRRHCTGGPDKKSVWAVWYFDLQSGVLTRLAHTQLDGTGGGAMLSPVVVHQRRVFLRDLDDRRPGLVVHDLSDGRSTSVSSDARKIVRSPDGARIAYLSLGPSSASVNVLAVASNRLSKSNFELKRKPDDLRLSWNPDGMSVIVFGHEKRGGIYETEIDQWFEVWAEDRIGPPYAVSEDERRAFLENRMHVRVPRYSNLSNGVSGWILLSLVGVALSGALWAGFRARRNRMRTRVKPADRSAPSRSFCRKCGEQVGSDADYCEQCGSPVS